MNKEKLTYLSPTTETLVVGFESTVLQASKFSPKGTELIPVDPEEDF